MKLTNDGTFFQCKMPKYYIKSGQIKYIIDRVNYEEAILEALRHYKNTSHMTSHKICVSEKGFDDHKSWECYNINDFTKKI